MPVPYHGTPASHYFRGDRLSGQPGQGRFRKHRQGIKTSEEEGIRIQPSLLYKDYLPKIKQIGRLVLPIFFPRHCPVCNRLVSYGHRVCSSCYRILPFIRPPFCLSCGKPISDEREEYCYDCRKFAKSFQGGCSLLLYNKISAPGILDYKYNNRRVLTDFYTEEIIYRYYPLFRHWKLQAVVPVPVHRDKKQSRGYNQAELLSSSLSARLSLPHYPDLLVRSHYTLPQKQFTPQARLTNLRKAFDLNAGYTARVGKIKSLLIVDDIYTSGATMEACSRILHGAGVENIYICTVCIGEARD